MARITMEEQQEFVVFPVDSIVLLKIEGSEIQTVDGKNGSWQKLNFSFKVMEVQAMGDGSPVSNADGAVGQRIWGSVPFKLTDSPENRLRQWAEAIFNLPLGVGFELDTDAFDGKLVRGITNQYEKRTTNPATGRPYMAHQVNALLPYGAGSPPPVAAPAPEDPWATAAPSAPAAGSYFADEPPF